MAKLSTSKKILLASLLVGVLIIGAVVTIVLVLAASTQNVASNVRVTYQSSEVAGTIKFSQAKKGEAFSGEKSVTFTGAETTNNSGDLSPDAAIALSSSQNYVVFRYEITGLSDDGFYVSLEYKDMDEVDENTAISYTISSSEISDFNSLTNTVPIGTITKNNHYSDGQKIYMYVKVQIARLTSSMMYSGAYNLVLSRETWTDTNHDATTGIDYGYVENTDGTPYAAAVGYSGTANSITVNTTSIYGSSLPVVTIENGAFATGTSATASSKALTSITIGANVKKIKDNAFKGNTSLTTFTIPATVISIGRNILEGCTNITSFTAPVIGDMTESIIDVCFGSTTTSVTYTMNGVSAENPSTVKRLVIPSSVTSIPDGFLSAYTNLEYLEFPCVFDDRFGYLFGGSMPSSLNTVSINGGTSIPNYAFQSETDLTKIIISDSITSIGTSAFQGCSGLTSITIPSGVTRFVYNLFSGCTNLKQLTIPNGVTNIENNVFYNCSSLTSITIPSSVISIDGVFYGCTSLSSIIVDSGNIRYNSGNGGNCIIDTATNTLQVGCKNTIIPNGVTSISRDAFYNCRSLTSIAIPEGVTSIGTTAFSGCSSLTSITIPNSVTYIGTGAFYGCTNNLSYNEYDNALYLGNSENPYMVLMKAKNTSITSCQINENVKIIYETPFASCSNLTYTNYNNALYLGNDDNPYLALISAANQEISSCTVNNMTKFICDSAFYNCTSLADVVIGNSVESIGNDVFYSCPLSSVVMPNNVKNIGNNLFTYCDLSEMTFSSGIDVLRADTFFDMSIMTVVLPNVSVICAGAFDTCYALSSVTISNATSDNWYYINSNGEEVTIDLTDASANAQLFYAGDTFAYTLYLRQS